MLTQTDMYKDHVFPAGTVFFANTWALHHDENEYTNPHEFNPNRWLHNKYGTVTDDTERYTNEQRKLTYSWGNGRRICSGQKLAENSLQMGIAKLVWAFDIDVLPERHEEVDDSPLSGYQGGFVVNPYKYPVRIRPRSDRHAEIVRKEVEDMKPFLAKFKSV